jgi:putative transposase
VPENIRSDKRWTCFHAIRAGQRGPRSGQTPRRKAIWYRYGAPEIFNTDQGVQFTAAAFIAQLQAGGIQVSMDGKGRFLDNIFIERLWRSLKYEEIFLKAYGSVAEARLGINAWMKFYNEERKHQALGYRTPREIFADSIAHGYVHNASALHTYPQAQQSQTEKDSIYEGKVIPAETDLLAA